MLESFRSQQFELCSTLIQATARGYIARNRFSGIHAKVIALQACARGFLAKKHLEEQQNSAVAIQCMYRSKAARCELVARKEAKILVELEEKQRKAAMAAEQNDVLEKEKVSLVSVVDEEEKQTMSEMAELKSELERVKAELEATKAEAAKSKARVATLEVKNKSLKQQITTQKKRVPYSGRPPSHYSDQPDLRDIAEEINLLMYQSKENKRDLNTLAKALEKLR